MEVSVGGFLISFSTRGLENEVLGTILWNFVLVQILLLSCVFVWAEILRKVKRGSNFSQFKVESRSAEDEKVREQKSDSFPDLQTVTVCETGLTWAIPSLHAGFTFIFAEVVCGEIWLVKENTGLMGMASHPQPPLAGGVAYHGSQVTTSSIHPKLLHWILLALEFLLLLLIHIFSQNYASYFLAERMLHRRLRRSTKQHYKGGCIQYVRQFGMSSAFWFFLYKMPKVRWWQVSKPQLF